MAESDMYPTPNKVVHKLKGFDGLEWHRVHPAQIESVTVSEGIVTVVIVPTPVYKLPADGES